MIENPCALHSMVLSHNPESYWKWLTLIVIIIVTLYSRYKQLGTAAVEACNVFFHLTYPGKPLYFNFRWSITRIRMLSQLKR